MGSQNCVAPGTRPLALHRGPLLCPAGSMAPPVQSGQRRVLLGPGEHCTRRAVPADDPASHGDLGFAVGAQVPGPAARAAVKAAVLCAESLGQLLHAELAPGRVAGPPGRGRGLGRWEAAVDGPGWAAGGPRHVGAGRRGAGGRRVPGRGPGAGVQQRRKVLGGPRSAHREGPPGQLRGGKTLVEVLGRGLCGDRPVGGVSVRLRGFDWLRGGATSADRPSSAIWKPQRPHRDPEPGTEELDYPGHWRARRDRHAHLQS